MRVLFLVVFAVVGLVFLISSVPSGESMRMVWSLEKMTELSDVIATGTIKSTWIDIRPFEDYKVTDTATVAVDQWIKNKQDSDTLEIRYYGYWSQTIDNLFGKHRSDTPIHNYESGQEVLLLVTHEESTMVMGGGYYPIFEGDTS